MNRLQFETSPYLLQHQHNPVDWFAWKPEAFEKAKSENKPILVSIGYATCHWCHVMERESFEDPAVGAFMSEHFVCIKVDREERPDVDQVYMNALIALEGHGGWPLNMFLTPEGKPFMGGTYYPPVNAHGRPSWKQVLTHMAHVWKTRTDEVLEQADKLTNLVAKSEQRMLDPSMQIPSEAPIADKQTLQAIFEQMKAGFDEEDGGFGGAPKFPGTMSLHFLLDYYFYTNNKQALDHARLSLEKMACGGIYDLLGGGFSRYATDSAWLIPHFEKMLYDNALLLSVYAEMYKIEPKPLYEQTIRETIAFIYRELTHEKGGFLSALDADSEGVEGKFYVWSYDEIAATLPQSELELFCVAYDVTPEGNWEHNNILWRHIDLSQLETAFGATVSEMEIRLADARKRLMQVRNTRIRPITDDKQLLSWNALMITGLLDCGMALNDENIVKTACAHLDQLLLIFVKPNEQNRFFHTYKDGKGQYNAMLEDLSYLSQALLNAYKAMQNKHYLELAEQLTDDILARFSDDAATFCYVTAHDSEALVVRTMDLYDSATPSANSTLAHVLLDLAILRGRIDFQQRAERMLRQMAKTIVRNPHSMGRWAKALLRMVYSVPEVAIIGEQHMAFANTFLQKQAPNALLEHAIEADDDKQLLHQRIAKPNETLVFVCFDQICKQVVNDIESAYASIRAED